MKLPTNIEDFCAYYGTAEIDDAIDSIKTGYKICLKLQEEGDIDAFREVRRKSKKNTVIYRMFFKIASASAWTEVDVWFLGYSTSSSGGAKVRFELPNTVWQQFRLHGQGQTVEFFLLEMGDDGEWVNQVKRDRLEKAEGKLKGGPLSKNAARLCQEPGFQKWVGQVWSHQPVLDDGEAGLAKAFIYNRCQIKTRIMLDHNSDAAKRYMTFVKKPFQRYLVAAGLA